MLLRANCSGSGPWLFYRISPDAYLYSSTITGDCVHLSGRFGRGDLAVSGHCVGGCTCARCFPAVRQAPGRDCEAPRMFSVLTGDQVVQILDETVDWYRTLGCAAAVGHATERLLILLCQPNRQPTKLIGLAV